MHGIVDIASHLLSIVFVGVLKRVLAHGSGLGVVEGGVGVEVVQVLGRVFADAQVPDGVPGLGIELGARHVGLVCVLLLVYVAVVVAVFPHVRQFFLFTEEHREG